MRAFRFGVRAALARFLVTQLQRSSSARATTNIHEDLAEVQFDARLLEQKVRASDVRHVEERGHFAEMQGSENTQSISGFALRLLNAHALSRAREPFLGGYLGQSNLNGFG